MNPTAPFRLVRASALYDLLVAAPFATPWSAPVALAGLAALHAALRAPGATVPPMAPTHLLFIAFFGTVVTMWALLRLLRPRVEHALTDGLGRLAFSAWQAWALGQGASGLLAGFLVVELGFGVAQLLWWARETRDAWRRGGVGLARAHR